MSPFSPLHFIKENKSRCIMLMIMLFLSFGTYLGGLYVSNPNDNWKLSFSYYDDMAIVGPVSGDEEKVASYMDCMMALEETGKVKVLPQSNYSMFGWKTIMGFESGNFVLSFCSVEDFKAYCEYLDIECDYDNLKSGSMIMSDRFAKNRGLKLGDKIDKGYDTRVYYEHSLDAVTDEDGYTLYFIDGKPENIYSSVVIGNGISGDEVYRLLSEFGEQYEISVKESIEVSIKKEFEVFNLIYTFVVILLSVILAVTINAAFVGMYQRRTFEFAVYRGIGISKKRIIAKIVGELLLMDGIVIVAGGVIFFVGLYLFNNMVLYPVGKYLCYFDVMAVIGFVLCNVMVLVPLIITRCRQMLKADICEY